MVHSNPFVVRLSQIGKLNSSLGVPKLSYMLEIMHLMHIDFLGRAIENLGGESLVDEPCLAKFFWKSNNLKDPLKLETKGKICEFGSF